MMAQPCGMTSGHTTAQYFVQATRRSSLPMEARITVALGWRETTRCGVWSGGMLFLSGWPAGRDFSTQRQGQHPGHR
jgi:hypothetical protein